MNQFFGFPTKDRDSLSASSLETLIGCTAKLFFESILDLGFNFPKHPSSIVGQVVHFVDESLLNRLIQNGPLPLSDKDRTVSQWKKFLYAVLLGTEVLPNRKPESIQWLSDKEMLLSDDRQQKIISQRIGEYVRKAELQIEAMYYLCSKLPTAVELIPEKRFDVLIDSTITPGQKIKAVGYMDLVTIFPSGRITVIDWKTGKRSAFTLQKIIQHNQMLLYAYAIKQLYGVIPDTYIVSQDVSFNDWYSIDEDDLDSKQNLLMRDPYLISIPMNNYSMQEPELIELFSEAWYVLSNLLDPPKSLMSVQEMMLWTPKTTIGQLVNLQENLRQGRPIPNISPACDYCNAKSMCQQFNAADWDAHREQQSRARLASIIPRPVGSRTAIIAQSVPEVPLGANFNLFPGGPDQLLTKQWRKAADRINWVKLGFIKVKSNSDKLVRKLFDFIPRHWRGALCPCVEGKWLWSELLNHKDEVEAEIAQCKAEQQQCRERGPDGKLIPMKPLRRSKVVEELITLCPVGNCPHRATPESVN